MSHLTALLALSLFACTLDPEGVEGVYDLGTVSDGPNELGYVDSRCQSYYTPTTLEDTTVGFDAAELLTAVDFPLFSRVDWTISPDVSSESMTLTCASTPLSAGIVTREVVTREGVDEAESPIYCPPEPELYVWVDCTLNLGDGSIFGAAPSRFGASSLDAISMFSSIDNPSVASDRLEVAASGIPGNEPWVVDDLWVDVYGDVRQAQVAIEILGHTPSGSAHMGGFAWLGLAIP